MTTYRKEFHLAQRRSIQYAVRALFIYQMALLSSAVLGAELPQGGPALKLQLRSVIESPTGQLAYHMTAEAWDGQRTAIIVCDTWDRHHSQNAVRRLTQFAPRMNQVVQALRKQGATVIHAPSDCMPAYAEHPARKRAMAVPRPLSQPAHIAAWCSQIPSEAMADYPIDQSDGGDDDDPQGHALWAEQLRKEGRNPQLPWQRQSELVAIDAQHDFISDRGDEVWNILQAQHIEHVILVGVHTNMCVLGRPFGLRQLKRNGMQVVLMRDMTDCMYNPQRWPYVDHFTGNDLVIQHVERYVCPTITSDQIVGGEPFRFAEDGRAPRPTPLTLESPPRSLSDYSRQWRTVSLPNDWGAMTDKVLTQHEAPAWYRCTISLSGNLSSPSTWELNVPTPANQTTGWLNGAPIPFTADGDQPNHAVGRLPHPQIRQQEANLLVLRIDHRHAPALTRAVKLSNGDHSRDLAGRWQLRLGDDPDWSNIPLPAKFGIGPDILFELDR